MATYVNKRGRMWKDTPLKPLRRRSEGRLKTYPSQEDIRTWSYSVEERRQQIIELVTRDIDKCFGKLVPLDVLMKLLTGPAIKDLKQLKKCLKQLWEFIDSLNLADGDKNRLKQLKSKMHAICKEGRKGSEECVAFARHKREMDDVDNLLGGKTVIKTKVKELPMAATTGAGPGRMTTTIKGPAKLSMKVKGVPPGAKIVRRSSKGSVTIRPGIPIDATSSAYNTTSDTDAQQQTPIRPKRSAATTPSKEGPQTRPVGVDSNPDYLTQLNHLQDQLAAREILCKEQQSNIQSLSQQKDGLQKKLQECLAELESFKKLNDVATPLLSGSCKDEIDALEAEIKIMRSGHLSPEEEAELIKKELDVLKKFCVTIKTVGDENEKLKSERDNLRSKLNISIKDSESNTYENMSGIKDKLRELEDLTRERDTLKNKVHYLEKKLQQYEDLPDDIEEIKNRAGMLNSVLQERDSLMMKIGNMKELEQQMAKLKEKADRADQLELKLRSSTKLDKSAGVELKKSISRMSALELELQNAKRERDAMAKRIEFMKKDTNGLKSQCREVEMLKLERDRLQIKLNELSDLQSKNDDVMAKTKMYDSVIRERDMYKAKYENVLQMECQCERLKAQVDAARDVVRQRDHLQKQVEDLEACICDQEEEIKRHVAQIENLSYNKDEQSSRMKRLSEEMEKKNNIIQASEEKLATIQANLKSNIQGVSAETAALKARIEELESQLAKAEAAVIERDCLIQALQNKSMEVRQNNRGDAEYVETMRQELEAAKAENKKLQEIAKKMMSLTGDEHVKKMLKQSECAVRRIVEELGRQYREWDHMRQKNMHRKISKNFSM